MTSNRQCMCMGCELLSPRDSQPNQEPEQLPPDNGNELPPESGNELPPDSGNELPQDSGNDEEPAPIDPQVLMDELSPPVVLEITDNDLENAVPWIPVASFVASQMQMVPISPISDNEEHDVAENQPPEIVLLPEIEVLYQDNEVAPNGIPLARPFSRSASSHNIIVSTTRRVQHNYPLVPCRGTPIIYANSVSRPAQSIIILSPDGTRILSPVYDSQVDSSVQMELFHRNIIPWSCKDFMDNLRMYTTLETYSHGNLEQMQRIAVPELCSICLDIFPDKCYIRYLQCRHVFHQRCSDEWLCRKMSCPVCRRELRREDS